MNARLSTNIYRDDKVFLNFKYTVSLTPRKYFDEIKAGSNSKIDIIIGLADDFLMGRLTKVFQDLQDPQKNNMISIVDENPFNLKEDLISQMVSRNIGLLISDKY